MPEIKHQFTGGKMNKDLDERLVPNGEYRDALNIQVSTSEDSEVGTVQNILGNSLLAGQDFISENAVCVGSIADEKNDKLYYFITQKELLSNGSFDNSGAGWYLGTDPTIARWSFTGNQATGLDGSYNYPYMQTDAPDIIEGRAYRITYDIIVASTGTSPQLILANHGVIGGLGTNGSDNNVQLIGETVVGTHSIDWLQGSSSTGIIRLYNNGDYDGTIDNISVKEIGDIIVEYDSKTNSITPVLVDTVGDVLKFNPDNIITGINIIDDLLFWTDNENEPKKINIQRSIEGTDSSGTVHTHFINDQRNDPFGGIREEHITVIKKAPKVAPTIELFSERPLDEDKIHTGVMKITTAPVPPVDTDHTWTPFGLMIFPSPLTNPHNTQNESSLWVDVWSKYNSLYDFSGMKIGSIFDTQIETDINGDSGFELSWAIGDTILFKEFGAENYDEPPEIPIKDYTIKAKIIEGYDLGFMGVALGFPGVGAPFSMTDQPLELAQNGDFTIPDANGNAPKYYSGVPFGGFTYVPGGNYILCNDVTQYQKISSVPSIPFVIGNKYIVSFTLSDYYPQITPLDGKIKVFIISPVAGANPPYWSTPYVNTTGTHTFTIDTSIGGSTGSDFDPYSGKWLFQTGDIGGVGFTGRIDNVSITRLDEINVSGLPVITNAAVRCEVLSINNPPVVPEDFSELRFAVDKLANQEKLFEFKFPRFAYRYQYEDREYSTMSPFSPIAFLPGSFDYHPKKGYNLGMTNRINEIGIKNFTTNVPDGVIAIDILYKDDLSPNIYVVDTIKPKHNPLDGGSNTWDADGDPLINSFIVTSEQISQMLPSNQLLRLWDNVPKKALAQDISGNRIIYGNYVQGFDLKAGDINASEDYYPDFNFSLTHDDNTGLIPKKSIKSLREYQLGVVFVDEYGRETPVISNKSGTYKLNKLEAKKINQIQVDFGNEKYPENMKYFKFFIKETSGEYYNLAMDRYYDAEDGQIWLSFPSSDRNKLDIDTFLILKKGVESNEMVSAEAKYKVLDIQNEAPDFIKQDKQLIEEKTHVFASSNIFENGLIDAPLQGNDSFKMNYDQFNSSSGSNLHEIKDSDLYIEFTNASNNTSKRYRITEITTDNTKYSVRLNEKFGDDINFITDDPLSGLAPSKINDGTVVNIYRYTKENSSKFDGRFFVKINIDSTFNENIIVESEIDMKYRTVLSKKLYYLSSQNQNNALHSTDLTGQTIGEYASDFGRFAPFFRNYKYPENELNIKRYDNSTDVQVGQYLFGDTDKAEDELKWITGGNVSQSQPYFIRFGNTNANQSNTAASQFWPGLKIADSHGWNNDQRAGTFNDAGEQLTGDVWFIDGGFSEGSRSDNSMNWYYPSMTNATLPGLQQGGQKSILSISLGGIFHAQEAFGSGNTTSGNIIENYYTISGTDSNPNYTAGSTENLVSKFYPGQKFRFREDPNGEIYTIQPTIHETQGLRWEHGGTFGTSPSYGIVNQHWNKWKDTDGDNHQEDPSGYSDYDRDSDYTNLTMQLSPNFTKNWSPYFKNSSGTGAISWNPVGDGTPGPITGGLKLAIDHSDSQVWDPINTSLPPYVVVDSLEATDKITGLKHNITTGMILTSHSDEITNATFDGTVGGTYSKEELVVKKIIHVGAVFTLLLSGYRQILTSSTDNPVTGLRKHRIFTTTPEKGQEMIFEQPKMNGYSQYSVNRINAQHSPVDGGIVAIGYNLEFVEAIDSEPLMPTNPAIWETEPKESTDLDIYYEASGLNPLKLEDDTRRLAIPLLSTVEHIGNGTNWIEVGTTVEDVIFDGTDWTVTLASPSDDPVATADAGNTLLLGSLVNGNYIAVNDKLKIIKPNGDIVIVEITGFGYEDTNNRSSIFKINSSLYSNKTQYNLNWHNCYSFGNGVESNRIRDNFNLPYISNGVKVSTTLEEGLGEEHRKYGLIYSGIYNSNSSTNNLNQFIAAEKITKDVNPIYGSIQKLHSRDSDLVTLCEDKCLRILANKDAIFNADGNPNLIATDNVLGQTYTFSGEFGISTNPESFASESYRTYFTDKVRGVVMRLSKDGLTPISMYGMKDWFKDNLKLSTKLIGSYDDRKDEYNITLADRKTLGEELIVNGNLEDDPTDEWFMSGGSTPHWFWDSVNNNMFSDADPHHRVGQYLLSPVTVGKSYEISWTVGKPITGELEGRLWVTLHDDSINYKVLPGTHWGSTTVGTYIKNVTVDTGWAEWIYGDMPSSINFHNKEATSGDGIWFNGTIDNISVKEIISDPITVSFKEDVKGWVSFKSFVPENGLSVANDYYTILGGKLYKHHIENTNRNNFYNTDYNSSVNVILNDGPGSVKSFHTLDYEGSQSRVEGIKTVRVISNVSLITGNNPGSHPNGYYFYFNTKEEMNAVLGYSWDDGDEVEVKQYRNNVLVSTGFIIVFDNPTHGLLGRYNSNPQIPSGGDWQVGDIITTELQEDSVNHFNITPKDGWYVSGIETDKQEGNIREFIEKEGKWFNYIKGVDSDITSETDFGAFDIQGIGILKQTITADNLQDWIDLNAAYNQTYALNLGWDWINNTMEFDGPINASLQIGDIIYYQNASNINTLGGFNTMNPNEIIKFAQVTNITSNTVTMDETVFGSVNIPDPSHGAFIFFTKNHTVNTSSLLGYFADVKFENNSTEKIELFSVGSEITESSK